MAQHHTSGRQGQGARRQHHRNKYSNSNRRYSKNGGYRNKTPKLTFWQKLLKLVGLYKVPANPKRKKTNTRIAKPRYNAPAAKPPVNSPRLYVGNLSYEALESDLEDLFKGIGTVKSVEVIYNPRTHRSKGYAFVEMQFMDDAVRSVEVLHNQPFMGRLLTVSAANEKQERDQQDFNERENSGATTHAGFDPDDTREPLGE